MKLKNNNKQLRFLFVLSSLFFIGCATTTTTIKQINPNNHNDRIRFLVIHHTTIDYKDSIKALTNPHGVRSHYLIPDNNDESYQDDKLEVVPYASPVADD
ncbi:MAG: hypothetical protein COA74_02870 [Gammaproteobacteria bacterium]|nr:MAG: hypothetical protein COA74_02870 [Gammaproteobacteria bacterium]